MADINGNYNSPGLPPGAIILHYKIVQRLGRGATGEVYLADDLRLERRVALKFLPTYADEARQSLIDEARAASKLAHPNIASIYSLEEQGGRDFIVMEYVDGVTLDEHIGRKPAIDETLQIAIQICAGLAEAHRHGIVHGDLKPQNIMIDQSGKVKICDFGLARLPGKGRPGQGASPDGTLLYMSPEQAQCREIDQRSDLFSLGIILYEIISGKRPFQGEYEAAIVYSIANETPAPLTGIRPDLPQGIDRIVARLLEKDPDKRYGNAEEVAADLKSVIKPATEGTISRPIKYKATALAALLVAFVVIVWVFVIPSLMPARDKVGQKAMIAVLPFENLGATEYDYWADGIEDAITTSLAKISGLGVISRTSTRQYKNSNKTIRQIGKELGIGYAIEGTVLLSPTGSGDSIRVNVQLIRVADDTHVWAETFDRAVENIFAIHSEIAGNVSRELDIKLLSSEEHSLRARPTSDAAAYDYYLRGLYYYGRSWQRRDVEMAIEMLERAVQEDSTFALAYALLSRAHSQMFWDYYDRTEKRLKQAREAVEAALALNPDLPEAHLAIGMYYYSTLQFNEALKEFRIAERREPGNSDLSGAIAGVLRRQGKFDKALVYFSRAYRLDPRSQIRAFDVGLTLSMVRRYKDADSLLDQTVTLSPDWPLPYIYKAWNQILWRGDKDGARRIIDEASRITDLSKTEYYRFYWWLASIIDTDYNQTLKRIVLGPDSAVYYLSKAKIYQRAAKTALGQAYFDSARTVSGRLVASQPGDPNFQSQLGMACAGLGLKGEAIASGKKAVELLPYEMDAYNAQFMVANLAEIYVMVGEYDLAIDLLKELLRRPGFASAAYIRSDPIWAPLWKNRRFSEIDRAGR